MKTFLYFFLMALILSCKPNSSLQKKAKSVEELPWIKEQIASFKKNPFPSKSAITTYQHKGKTVYLIESCYECPDAVSLLYNSKKEKLCTFGGMIANTNNCPDFFEEATDKKIIWKNF